MIYDITCYNVFVDCNLVDTRRQQYSTHLHTNSTQNKTMKQNRTYIKIKYINITIKMRNLQNQAEAYTTYTHIYTDTKWNQKNMKECDKRNSHISS
jgi:Na+-transporting NADH:ubiquinone oxidoreductase subunit NqrC